MQKRGQVTIFIIIGVIVVFLFLVIYLKSQNKEEIKTQDFSQVTQFIKSCVDMAADEGIKTHGMHAGYHSFVGLKTHFSVPFYQYEDQSFMPVKEKITNELEKYVSEEFSECLNNYTTFKNEGYSFSDQEFKIQAVISDYRVNIEINYPLKITLDSEVKELGLFKENRKIPLGVILKLANNMTLNSPDDIPFEELINFAIKEDLYFEVIDQGGSIFLFNIRDDKSDIEGNLYEFQWTVKYDWEEMENKLLPINKQEMKVGEPFTYQLLYVGEFESFTASPNLFEISDDGLISLIPKEDMKGSHEIFIEALNKSEDVSFEIMEVEIS